MPNETLLEMLKTYHIGALFVGNADESFAGGSRTDGKRKDPRDSQRGDFVNGWKPPGKADGDSAANGLLCRSY